MKKTALAALVALALGVSAYSQARSFTVPLFTNYDLDVPSIATDADLILEVVDLTNIAFTLDADVAECREVTVTVTDTSDSINAGTITVVGEDCQGEAISWAIDVSGHGGGAVVYNSTDPAEQGREDYYFSTVTSITAAAVATLGGSSDETIIAGVLDATSPPISCVTYGGSVGGVAKSVAGGWIPGNAKVETSGASNTVTGVVAAEDAFLHVDAGDEIRITNHDYQINAQDQFLYRVVVTNADDDTITVNDPDLDLDDDSAGYFYHWRDRVCSQSELEGWVPVNGSEQVQALVNVERLDVDSEDGITLYLQCYNRGSDPILFTADTEAVTAVGVYDLTTTEAYDFCRVSMELDSTDSSTDTGVEIEDLDGVMHVRYGESR